MKSLIAIFMMSIFSLQSSSQCRVLKNEREDGVTVRYLKPDRIGHSDKLMLALSMQSNGEQYFVSTLSVFEYSAIKLRGNLTLKFDNQKSSTLEHYNSQITTFNGYPATVSVFIADKNDLENISSSNLSLAMLELESGVYQTVPVKMNEAILKNHYSCLSLNKENLNKPNANLSFIVLTERAYFYNEPREGTRRNAYFIRGNQAVGLRRENDFVYVEFTNLAGQTSKGWIRVQDISFQ